MSLPAHERLQASGVTFQNHQLLELLEVVEARDRSARLQQLDRGIGRCAFRFIDTESFQERRRRQIAAATSDFGASAASEANGW
jgi:hypothetical protein